MVEFLYVHTPVCRFFGLQSGIHTFAQILPEDTIYCSLPLYHTNGGVLSSGQMLFYGSTLVIRKKFSASNFWSDCIKYKCTVSRYAVLELDCSQRSAQLTINIQGLINTLEDFNCVNGQHSIFSSFCYLNNFMGSSF